MNFTAPKRPSSVIAIGLLVILVSILSWMVVRRQRVEDRVYKIGFDNQPPQHYIGEDGKPTGLAVELVGEAARRRGIRLQWLLEPESSEVALRTKKGPMAHDDHQARAKGNCLYQRSLSRKCRLRDCPQRK